ncbi:MAG: uracil-DNA glycosylase [Bdellovibrionales bacterium]|jgi:uracil-DNA glycosylase family 4|nr:uracil-DNA glycosylase [Bdellovibrionales bacterium]
MKSYDGFEIDETDSLANKIISCKRCPRLIDHCKAVADKRIMRRKPFLGERYWGRPAPNFGRLPAKLLIVGLAPGAHGANRTSRMFTGDDSGLWLYRALHESGFAQTDGHLMVGDNKLLNCSITAAAHCAPPDNKPTPEEIKNCEPFLLETLKLARPKVVLALGGVAWKSSLRAIEGVYQKSTTGGGSKESLLDPFPKPLPGFAHGAEHVFSLTSKTASSQRNLVLLGSYHVSRQNTNTGRLTRAMLKDIFDRARELTNET